MNEQQWMKDFVERFDRETANPGWILKSNTEIMTPMPNMHKPLDLDAIEARANAATPGPWEVEEYVGVLESTSVLDRVSEPTHDWERRIIASSLPDEPADAAFIAHARTDVPALIAEVRRLRVMEARLKEVILRSPYCENITFLFLQWILTGEDNSK